MYDKHPKTVVLDIDGRTKKYNFTNQYFPKFTFMTQGSLLREVQPLFDNSIMCNPYLGIWSRG